MFVSFSAHWESNKSIGGVPQLKGARNFSFEELRKYSNNFSETNDIGSGGYGNVSLILSESLILCIRAWIFAFVLFMFLMHI